MTSPTRDQIAQTIEAAISDAWWERGGKKVSTREQARAAADALIAAGLVVPEGTPETRVEVEVSRDDGSVDTYLVRREQPAVLSTVCAVCGGATAVPSGLTAEMRRYAEAPVTAEWCSMVRRQLRVWADALGVPETKTTETP